MVNKSIEAAQQRGFFAEVMRVLLKELETDGFMKRQDLKTRITYTPWVWPYQGVKALLAFSYLEGSLCELAIRFKNPRLPVLHLAPTGGVRYDDDPWGKEVCLRDDVYGAMREALPDACREFLRQQGIKVSAEGRQFFEL
ncbi:MAG TPA: hypothetical protein VFZ48_05840 [Candidatus Saccharimonadales bacterium]